MSSVSKSSADLLSKVRGFPLGSVRACVVSLMQFRLVACQSCGRQHGGAGGAMPSGHRPRSFPADERSTI
jgi:hypothetical protein